MSKLTMIENFMVFSDGHIEHISSDDTTDEWRDTDLYGTLLLAGYPLHSDPTKTFDGIIDIGVDPTDLTDIVVFSGPREHRMGPAAELFLRWYRENAL